MFWTKKVVIGDGERGLVYRDRRFARLLMPGVYRLFDPLHRLTITLHAVGNGAPVGAEAERLIEALGPQLETHCVLADIGAHQVGLLLRNGVLDGVLPPGSRTLYWRGATPLSVQVLPLSDGLQVPTDVQRRLRQLGTLSKVASCVEVPADSVGLVSVDGTLAPPLPPGAYAFWNFQNTVVTEVVDLRVQSVEVSGQELLTRDKVSLRVNLAASMRITDAVAMRTRVAKAGDVLYRELQDGLRRAVASKTLDELLGDKASLDADIVAHVRGSVHGFGIEVLGVGFKDVILPGEMRAILNAVVQAEKQAQANVIRRREEANATRSLLNTAKLIEESSVLMRLKELEALEKVTEKIDTLTVFGGLDGVLKQLVTLR